MNRWRTGDEWRCSSFRLTSGLIGCATQMLVPCSSPFVSLTQSLCQHIQSLEHLHILRSLALETLKFLCRSIGVLHQHSRKFPGSFSRLLKIALAVAHSLNLLPHKSPFYSPNLQVFSPWHPAIPTFNLNA